MAEIKSKEIQGVGAVKDRRYRTISTYDNGLKKTVTQEKISKTLYDQRFLTTPTLVTDDGNGKYFVTVRDGDNDTIYADLDFQKEYAKPGNTSLKNQLGLEQLNALDKGTDVPRNILQQQVQNITNVAQEVFSNLNLTSDNVPLSIQGKRRKAYEDLFYPEDIGSSKQDRIKFGMRYISGQRSIKFDGGNFDPLQITNRSTERIEGSVTLPIPGGISDKNSVKFEGENLNVLQAAGVGAILNPVAAAQAGADFLRNAMTMTPDQLAAALGSDSGKNIVSALRIGLAQQFTGTNLFSRLGGGILNPNMELLFQAPTLRSFNFSFTMSARSGTEAAQIKKIIRFFKQGMSVKKSTDNIFVVSPNIFTIKYQLGNTEGDHPSIGKIKNCALTDLNTTYGNGNTYMSYDDPTRTMTQYKIDLSFQELDPITDDDYTKLDSDTDTQIGF
tara:strand:- start:75 stop:1406 length:1332 start_codon:yes stop_codon:yes gene_type:complete